MGLADARPKRRHEYSGRRANWPHGDQPKLLQAAYAVLLGLDGCQLLT